MHDRDFNECIRKFLTFEKCKKEGRGGLLNVEYYWQSEPPPDPDFYISSYIPYEKENANGYQVFETESIGTSITSSFATQEDLIDHLINHGESLNPVNTGRIKPGLRR